jgi:hypothetical protein
MAKKRAQHRRTGSRVPAKRKRGPNANASRARGSSTSRWSAGVMKQSDALDLERGVFKLRSARAVAHSLKKSAETSHRRKASPFQSAMSMLNFEINRGGKTLSAERRRVLNGAKVELRKAFGRPPGRTGPRH